MAGCKWSDVVQYAKWPLCGHCDVNAQWAYFFLLFESSWNSKVWKRAPLLCMCSGDDLGDSKCWKKAARSVKFNELPETKTVFAELEKKGRSTKTLHQILIYAPRPKVAWHEVECAFIFEFRAKIFTEDVDYLLGPENSHIWTVEESRNRASPHFSLEVFLRRSTFYRIQNVTLICALTASVLHLHMSGVRK